MERLLATLGFDAEKALHGIRKVGGDPQVTLLCGVQETPLSRGKDQGNAPSPTQKAQFRTLQAAAIAQVRRTLEPQGSRVQVERLASPFDFVEAVVRVRRLLGSEAPRRGRGGPTEGAGPVACDISGGPGVLAAAVLLAAALEGTPVHYANLQSGTAFWLPILRIPYRNLLSRPRLRVLESLASGPRTGSALAATLGIRESTVSHHLRALREHGLVERVLGRTPRRSWRVWQPTDQARMLL